ncbi:hypothetical protein PC111_g7563 [Phytophthora cactorum]|nr:hypothetical protein PC111_g7563 [Phytophthora cactorum]KAG2902937.1 hypothetical protein PC114_g12486 [Phytophthora cactorum]KAG3089046.1 hypothetical protein PC122_g8054 [Phytophthora cactorum]
MLLDFQKAAFRRWSPYWETGSFLVNGERSRIVNTDTEFRGIALKTDTNQMDLRVSGYVDDTITYLVSGASTASVVVICAWAPEAATYGAASTE